jgi:hypothetical protein
VLVSRPGSAFTPQREECVQPLAVYINWTAYDELSDTIELTEALAMQQFDELLRLRSRGVRFDSYLMDAFWYDPDSGYRAWRKPHWPDGPQRWLDACAQAGVIPGLWVSTNSLCHLNPVAAWEDSLNRERTAMCMFDGGFLADFIDVLQHWYDRGIRVFKFDFVRFDAATPNAQRTHLPHEIIQLNSAALRTALGGFRRRNPDVRLLAYNGFGGIQENTSKPFRKTVDIRLLDVFDSLYCGDPCPADVPMMSFWRAQDIYSDHMVQQYVWNGIPLERIDNSAFMIGKTEACYRRATAAWKGMLLLMLARGGLVSTYYGNLELLDDEQAAWFAKAQKLFLHLRACGQFSTFGGIAGRAEPYGYLAWTDGGALCTMVNPSQSTQAVPLAGVLADLAGPGDGRILFRDAGFDPKLTGAAVTLGPEQMCVIGYGRHCDAAQELGVQEDVTIPASIQSLSVTFERSGHNEIRADVTPSPDGDVRIVMTQSQDGIAFRTSGGHAAGTPPVSEFLRIVARQAGADVPVRAQHDRRIWSGLSWVVGEISRQRITPDKPLRIVCSSAETRALDLTATVYRVEYARGS